MGNYFEDRNVGGGYVGVAQNWNVPFPGCLKCMAYGEAQRLQEECPFKHSSESPRLFSYSGMSHV